jgi:multidrug efflux system outer membrane protein
MSRAKPNLIAKASKCLLGAILSASPIACTVGPNYHRPEQNMPLAFKSATRPSAPEPSLRPDWWRLLGDAKLAELEDAALVANTDVQAAMARVMEARAAARVVQSQFFPTITLDPSVARSRGPANVSSGGSSSKRYTTQTDVLVPVDLGYEIDVWGRVRRSYQASAAQARASENDYYAVRLTLAADVAQTYFNLRSLDAQRQILVKTVEAYRRQVALTQTQFDAGLATQSDLLQAQTLFESTTTQEIEIRRQRTALEHALAILLGRTPSELSLAENPLDLSPPTIPVGLPADLLRRRPDVAVAEQNLIAANEQIGVATAEFYPTFRLTGAAGFGSVGTGDALNWASRIWSIAPSASFPIFEGGKLNANLAQARARYDELVANYRGTVLGAVRDVDDSLNDIHLRADEATAQTRAVESSREYVRLSQMQYERGLTNYLQVIDAERTLLGNELASAQILNQRFVSTVLLIKALGGGWDAEAPHNNATGDNP